MYQTIPVLSLEDFVNGTPAKQAQFVQGLGDALIDIGFFALTHHGVDAGLIRNAYAVSEDLFSFDSDTKTQYEDVAIKGQRGFVGFGREHAKGAQQADLKEFWHIGRETAQPANIWPTEVPEFKTVMVHLFAQLERCADILLAACAQYLELPTDFFVGATQGSPTLLRVLHYPPVPPGVSPTQFRAAAHEDINLITLLCEASMPGLELLQNDGTWLPITAVPGQIIVDTGDMLQNLTNGLFKSTTHRVTNPENCRDRRFSLPFFVHPRPEIDLSPLRQCVVKTGGQSRFPSITAGEYLSQRLAEIGLA